MTLLNVLRERSSDPIVLTRADQLESATAHAPARNAREKAGHGGKRPGAGAKPTTWTTATETLFFQAVGSGSSLKDACRFAGFDFHRLQERRAKDPAFGDRLEKALNDVKIGLLAQQMIHSRKHHGATEWLLERRWPEEFGRRTTHEVSGGETPIKVELDVDAEIADKLRLSPEQAPKDPPSTLAITLCCMEAR